MQPEIAIVQEWHTAINNGDKEKLSSLVDTDVMMGGPRGSTIGVHALHEWLDQASIRLTPRRYFQWNDVVVVEGFGEWHAPGTEAPAGGQVVATVFIVRDHRIVSIIRYDTLQKAFRASGAGDMDEVSL